MSRICPASTEITELKVEPVDSTRLTVSWELPSNPNGPIDHYIVLIRDQEGPDPPSPDDVEGYVQHGVDSPSVCDISLLNPPFKFSFIYITVYKQRRLWEEAKITAFFLVSFRPV